MSAHMERVEFGGAWCGDPRRSCGNASARVSKIVEAEAAVTLPKGAIASGRDKAKGG